MRVGKVVATLVGSHRVLPREAVSLAPSIFPRVCIRGGKGYIVGGFGVVDEGVVGIRKILRIRRAGDNELCVGERLRFLTEVGVRLHDFHGLVATALVVAREVGSLQETSERGIVLLQVIEPCTPQFEQACGIGSAQRVCAGDVP